MLKDTLLLPRPDESIPIHLTLWHPDGEVRGIVQLAHGMAEHIERYDALARTLADHGFLTAGYNHRGHGKECPAEKLGFFALHDGWEKIIGDMHAVMQHVKALHPHAPFILLGHSMGSFAAREVALRYGKELSGLVLSGTGAYPHALCKAGAFLAGLFPRKKPAPLLDKIVFSGNNKPFAPARTPFDWLSRDERQVDAYIADPRCGFVFTGSAYRDFFQGLERLTHRERLAAMPQTLPIYLLSGNRDPVGQMGAGVIRTAEAYKQAGLTRVTVQLYPDGRHEMFNEINRDEVLTQLLHWLDTLIP